MSQIKERPTRQKNGLFASRQFLTGRLVLTTFVAAAMAIAGLDARLYCFLFIALSASLYAQVTINKHWRRQRDVNPRLGAARAALSFLDCCLYALASVLMRSQGGTLPMEFSLIILMITTLYCLMYFYTQGRLLMFLMAPCLASLAYSGFSDAQQAINQGHALTASLPLIGGALAVYFIYNTRKQLAAARLKLERARLSALQSAYEAGQANQAKSNFLAMMGHEIRTPLNGVLGVAQIMSRDALPQVQRERLSIITQSGDALLAILNDLMDFSKIEAGHLELEQEMFELHDLLKGAHASFSAAAELKNIGFELVIEPTAGGMYKGDSARLRQIFHNILSNAVKFTDEGCVNVLARFIEGELIFVVTDTGVGIPSDKLDVLGGKFVQVDASATRRHGGSGLGLAIVTQLLTLMGGRLAVQSELGKGSVFTATVPLTRLDDGVTQGAAAEVDACVDECASPLRILAAEDNAVNQMVLRALLQPLDPVLEFVQDGEQAIAAWEAANFDLILMDIQMPVMDGMAAALQIRQREGEQGRPRTPIIAVSANAMTHQRAAYIAAGMNDLVSKPLQAENLYNVLHAALQANGAQSAAAAEFDAAA